MSDEAVLLDVTDGIATITLNQPERMNALSDAIKAGIRESLTEVESRDDTRCVVIEGSGRAFSAGGDVKSQKDRLEDAGGMTDHDRAQRMERDVESISIRLFNFPLPTIAKVDGYCVGAGMGLAFACDVQLASVDAGFGLVFRNVGLTLDFATSYLLPRIVGTNTAKELALTGEIIDGERAAEIGLVNHVYSSDEFEEKASEFIEQIGSGPTVALHYSTRNIDRGADTTIREAVELEASAQNIARRTHDHEEGVTAFAEDREPEFIGE